MTLELVYWLALGVGLGMLVIAVVVGDVLDIFDIEVGGTDLAAGPIFFAAAAAFGAGGLLGIRALDLGPGASSILGLATGAVFGAATGGLFALLRKQEAEGTFEVSALVGARAQVTVALAPGQVGKVTITHEGMTRAYAARSDDTIAVGESVVVQDVVGSQMTVARPATSPDRG